MGDSGEYHGYFMCVSWVVHGCIILFHCCFIGVCFEGVGSLFRGCFHGYPRCFKSILKLSEVCLKVDIFAI